MLVVLVGILAAVEPRLAVMIAAALSLIVGRKVAAEEWATDLPDNVAVAHWGAIRGLDTFKGVRGFVTVGRWA